MGKRTPAPIAERLQAVLEGIDRPGTFCVSGALGAVLPGLEVQGMGSIGLPLPAAQARALRRRCEQAPYGKGTQTLVDTRVRRVWRLAPSRFALTNPAWPEFLGVAVARVQAELGLERQRLTAHLHDLLLYEEGCFFKPHRDGEKRDRMVATLVITLPAVHGGGELVVRHEGQEHIVDFSGPEGRHQIQFAAFYADCEHEVKPLRSGHRLCLVYNLALAKSKAPLGAPLSQGHIADAAEVLREWAGAAGGPQKLAVTLAHRYTADGLAWDALKGVDGARARVLAAAARAADCHVALALLTFWEHGTAECDDEPYGRGWGGRGRHAGEQYSMGEVLDWSLSAKRWRSPEGDRLPFGEIPFEREEIVPPDSLTDVEPKEDFEGYTGNAGMTLERWYRHAAVALWPRARHADVLCAGGSPNAVPALRQMVKILEKAQGEDADSLKARGLELAGRILERWPANPHRGVETDWTGAGRRRDPSGPLARLGDIGLIGTYLRDVLARDAQLEPGKGVARIVDRCGWAALRADLVALFQATDGETLERNARLLDRLCRFRGADADDTRIGADQRETCARLAAVLVASLERLDTGKPTSDWRASRVERARVLPRLVRALLAADLRPALERLVAHMTDRPGHYSLRGVQLPALARLGPWLRANLSRPEPALSRWIAACVERLQSLTAAAPGPPADHRRDAELGCPCRDCAELARFLRDPDARERGFQMPQDRRRHLEDRIRACRCDVDCRTDTRPRPQILICVKNTASFERRAREHDENLESLSALRTLRDTLPA
jgi:hypothetical protein